MGSGTTCIAALRLGRHYVGYDISSDYCRLAETVLAEEHQASKTASTTDREGRASLAGVKTECTELAVALGLLGAKNPLTVQPDQLDFCFEGTLSAPKYVRFQAEYKNPTNEALYTQMFLVGQRLRSPYPLFAGIATLQWTGSQKLANTASASMDLFARNTAISVKAGSNVVGNQSPYNVFICMPQGMAEARTPDHWYLSLEPEGYQQLYSIVRQSGLEHLPTDVVAFEKRGVVLTEWPLKAARRLLSGPCRGPPTDISQDVSQSCCRVCHHIQ